MAVGRVARTPALPLVLSVAALAGCETRNVYLVGAGEALRRDSSATGHWPPDRDSGRVDFLDGGTDPFDSALGSCGVERNAQPIPSLGLYVMVDQSSSLQAHWTDVSAGLQAFVVGTTHQGSLSVGIQYYPLIYVPPYPAPPPPNPACVGARYAVPDVAIAAVTDVNGKALADSINAHGALYTIQLTLEALANESPIDAALQGAISGARSWAFGNTLDVPAVVVVTTGLPSTDVQSICSPALDSAMAAVADGAEGAAGAVPVRTYVVSIGGPNGDLDQIATAGGTGHAYPASTAADIASALGSIREAAAPCVLTASSEDLASDAVNVVLTSAGRPRETYYRVNSVAACDGADGGADAGDGEDEWYVDQAGPVPVGRLCPATCQRARATPGAALEVILGCRTRLLQ